MLERQCRRKEFLLAPLGFPACFCGCTEAGSVEDTSVSSSSILRAAFHQAVSAPQWAVSCFQPWPKVFRWTSPVSGGLQPPSVHRWRWWDPLSVCHPLGGGETLFQFVIPLEVGRPSSVCHPFGCSDSTLKVWRLPLSAIPIFFRVT